MDAECTDCYKLPSTRQYKGYDIARVTVALVQRACEQNAQHTQYTAADNHASLQGQTASTLNLQHAQAPTLCVLHRSRYTRQGAPLMYRPSPGCEYISTMQVQCPLTSQWQYGASIDTSALTSSRVSLRHMCVHPALLHYVHAFKHPTTNIAWFMTQAYLCPRSVPAACCMCQPITATPALAGESTGGCRLPSQRRQPAC